MAAVIRRNMKVKCKKRDANDKEFIGMVTHVHSDKQHIDMCGGPLGMLSRQNVPIKFVEVL